MHNLVYFYPEGHEKHCEMGHPECPERVEVIRSSLQEIGLWGDYPQVKPVKIPIDVMHKIHTPDYLVALEEICQSGKHFDADTYTTRYSWELALNAAGGAIAVASSVWRNDALRGFALTRPPGHHATQQRAMGFCLLNNVAIAAEYLIQVDGAVRIAIVDLDLHHGNGTQDIFFRRGDVFYASTHQYPLYPGTGWLDETGEGAGERTTANFPLPPFSGDQAFLTIMDTLIVPLLDRFHPDMILVSYGFDTHWSDPLGSLLLTSKGYAKLIERLVDWADQHCRGRIALFLEGGYNLDAARACSLAVVSALLGEQIMDVFDSEDRPYEGRELGSWQPVVKQAKRIWGINEE
jgi:acetoin utilization deacetylase AcuC-like enzyme